MSRFYFGGSSNSSGSDDDDDTLPYPTPLQRSDFLAPGFSPSNYLSTLHNRHQTLEDLRSELRSRSQLLSKELLDLVNSNYQDFLGLGRSLKSGDEKVEEVRVGLLGFRKEVEGVRSKVVERETDVKKLVDERVEIRKQIAVGRALVDYEARLALLEGQLMVETAGKSAMTNGYDDVSDSDEDSDDAEEGSYSMSISKLRKHVQQYRLIQEISKGIGENHPFITAQVPRMAKVRNTLLLDLSTALQQAKTAGAPGVDRVMKITRIYADMDESAEAIKVLKSLKAA
ncbi:hypothetical protein K469DRAFT_673718 [Zopfia rhizophila CBS 207.26]|uniref:Conserved oligomeric Golgi complex subunit 2 n=1 Tax=Zopfia rhizophila CBS 207.26 TaxID=1314779 RepID=A0A6A6DK35_9PEZI|nr:hypothetical protein K469DRAFT_673718 [Zopfia rhizophila CBS 207.26]